MPGNITPMPIPGRNLSRIAILLFFTIAPTLASAQAYQPKFKGDPARSDSEAAALGYIRTVVRSQNLYKKKYGHYATALTQLVHSGSFTRRMASTDRGDYSVHFKSTKDGYDLALTPKQLDSQHRAFYSSDDGVIHADEQSSTATKDSPVLKAG